MQGFKAFSSNSDYQEGKTYHLPNDIKLTKGPNGTGFYYTPHLEDTLRYVNGMTEEINIAQVTADVEIITFNDEYNGYYDICNTRKLTIDHIMSREEIMNTMLTKSEDALIRFISGYKLTDEEQQLIKKTHPKQAMINLAIKYYQQNESNAYKDAYQKRLYY